MKITRKLFVVFGALLLAVSAEPQEKTALEIIRTLDQHARSDSSELSFTMEIFVSEGSAPRVFTIASFENRDGHSLIEFTEPRTVQGMRILTRENSSWVFFPSTGRVRKIASGSRSGSVQGVGGDFSYGDLANDPWETSYAWSKLREDDVSWVLEGVKNDPDAAYDRVQLMVNKTLERTVLARFALESKGGYYKELELKNYRDFSGRLRAEQMIMTNLQKGSYTTVTLNTASFDRNLSDSLFDPSRFGR